MVRPSSPQREALRMQNLGYEGPRFFFAPIAE